MSYKYGDSDKYNIMSALRWSEEILVGKELACVLIDRPFSVCLDESDGSKTIKFNGKLCFNGKNKLSVQIKAFGHLGMLTNKPIVNIEYYSSGRPKHHFVCTPKIESLSTNEGFKEEKFVSHAMMGYWPQVPTKRVICFNVIFDLNVKSAPYPKAIYQNVLKVTFSEIKKFDF